MIFNQRNISAGLISALMIGTGGAILIIQSAQHFELTDRQLLSWIFVAYTFAGLFNLFLALRFKMPIAGAHSLTTAAFLSTAAVNISFPELTASFLMAGVIIAIFGFTGIFNALFKHIPRPVIEAMLAGIVMEYVIRIVPAIEKNIVVGLLAILGYFVAPRIIRSVPPIIGVIVFGVIGLLFTYSFPETETIAFHLPQWVMPEFTLTGFMSISLPIAILVLSNDLAVGLASLTKSGYEPPVNKTISYSGLATMFGSFFGGGTINIGGMMTTLCSSDEGGESQTRYRAGVVSSVLVIIFGVFAWKLVPYITVLPDYFITIIIGFSLLGVFMKSMKAAFSHANYRFSVVFTFIISVANVSFLGISSALWSLLIGTLLSILLKEGKETEVA